MNTEINSNSRLIAMGKRPLMEGFALMGFETFKDASKETLERLLNELLVKDQKAFVLLESYLSASQLKLLQEVRDTAVHIIIAEIPALNDYQEYHPYVEKLVAESLGQHVLDDETTAEELEAELEQLEQKIAGNK